MAAVADLHIMKKVCHFGGMAGGGGIWEIKCAAFSMRHGVMRFSLSKVFTEKEPSSKQVLVKCLTICTLHIVIHHTLFTFWVKTLIRKAAVQKKLLDEQIHASGV